MLKENLTKTSERWESDGLSVAKPLLREELIEKFANFGILLSQDVIEVYSTIGGFEEDEMDSECLTFWTVDKILKENKLNAEYIYFADFLIDSHHYAFKYVTSKTSEIYACYSDVYKVADSFTEFFEIYLKDVNSLFP